MTYVLFFFAVVLAVIFFAASTLAILCVLALVAGAAVDRQRWNLILPAPAQDVIVLYDGECGLCDSSVQFVLKHDRTKAIRFAPLQSQPGRQMAGESADLSTVVLWINGRLFRRSDAVAILLRQLGRPWSIAGTLLAFIPAPLRDSGYAYVAAHRHAWFPFRGASCRLGTSEERARFLA